MGNLLAGDEMRLTDTSLASVMGRRSLRDLCLVESPLTVGHEAIWSGYIACIEISAAKQLVARGEQEWWSGPRSLEPTSRVAISSSCISIHLEFTVVSSIVGRSYPDAYLDAGCAISKMKT
jgi:hypothetical protein